MTDWPSLSLYRMVVFPAASSPSMRMRISLLPNTLDRIFPILAVGRRQRQGGAKKKTRRGREPSQDGSRAPRPDGTCVRSPAAAPGCHGHSALRAGSHWCSPGPGESRASGGAAGGERARMTQRAFLHITTSAEHLVLWMRDSPACLCPVGGRGEDVEVEVEDVGGRGRGHKHRFDLSFLKNCGSRDDQN